MAVSSYKQPTQTNDIQVFPVAGDILLLRARAWERQKFEIEYALQRGSTENAYVIRAAKTTLINFPGEAFGELFLAALRERQLAPDTIVLSYIDPDRAATLKLLVAEFPTARLVCSNPAAISLESLLPELPKERLSIIKGEDRIEIAPERTLEFIPTPTPRWPDGACLYDGRYRVLFSDKYFGAHVCGDQVFDEGWQVYLEDRRYYFDCLMAPHANQVATNLEKLAERPAELYATGHGPLARYGRLELTNLYNGWLEKQRQKENSVALIYASAYGNTAAIAQAIARGIVKAGVAIEAINCEFAQPEEIKAAVEKSAGFIMGSPTLGGHAPTQIQTALGVVLSTADKQQLAGVFGSFGWSGEAVDILEGKFRDAGYRFGFEPIRVKFKPTDETLRYCEEAGTDFAQRIKRAQKRRRKQNIAAINSDRTEQAVGRIVGSLCVVTARKGDLTGAMLASWVSQATFTPPGITVAVAKERAIEAMLYKGDRFALNILGEGSPLVRRFAKNYAPGEDRFTDIPTEEADNGCPILTDAIAYLECQVRDRMECGDHWLLYAEAQAGQVRDEGATTALHHRRSGIHY